LTALVDLLEQLGADEVAVKMNGHRAVVSREPATARP
jgi:hypothetical protein